MGVARQRVNRGLAHVLRFRVAYYATWRPGKKLHAYRTRTPRYIKRYGCVCSDIPSQMLLVNGLGPPNPRGVLKGGVLAYQRRFGRRNRRYVRGRFYPKGTLFIWPYTGTALAQQGHVCVAQQSGRNPRLIQAQPRRGTNSRSRLYQMKKPVWCVLPRYWIGLDR